MPGPVVERGDRLALRTVERDDAAFMQRSTTDPRIRWSLGSVHHDSRAEEREGIEQWLESDGVVAFVACAVDDGETADAASGRTASDDAPPGNPDEGETTPVGSVSARHVDGDRPWLAYWLLPEYHGEGYGKEMVELAVDHVFRSHAVHGVSAGAYDFNEASRGLLESLGFTEEARRREARYIDGEYVDECQYGVLRDEWTAGRD
ncbi:GNAT family N-acetyltransferase [Halobacterium yunchengense]|uniref:GNAT family N-acetyltransferase n=1 Tax=Halobacterium yunchengense TaxID=3108497 RepID=UPI00300B4CB9